MIGRSGERGSEISILAVRHDDDLLIYIYIYDASAPKPCLNPGSSSDEDFIGSKTASLAAVFVYNFFFFFFI